MSGTRELIIDIQIITPWRNLIGQWEIHGNPNSFMIFPSNKTRFPIAMFNFRSVNPHAANFPYAVCPSYIFLVHIRYVLEISSSSQRLHWLQCRRGNDSPCCTSTGLPSNLGRPREAIKTKPTKTVILRTYNDLYCVRNSCGPRISLNIYHSSPHLCVGFLFLVVHSRPPVRSRRPLPPSHHTQPTLTHNVLTHNSLTHNSLSHTQLAHTHTHAHAHARTRARTRTRTLTGTHTHRVSCCWLRCSLGDTPHWIRKLQPKLSVNSFIFESCHPKTMP